MDTIAAYVSSSAITGDTEQKIFKSALFGFKRDDVLSYVEQLNRESNAAAKALKASIASLEADIATKSADNAILAEKLAGLEDELAQTSTRANDAEHLVNALRIEADRANDEAAAYKSSLFAKEQEAVVLKADNARLNQTIVSLTATVTEYNSKREELESLRLSACEEAEKIKADAKTEAECILAEAAERAEQTAAAARFDADSVQEEAAVIKANAEMLASAARQKADDEARLIRSKASNEADELVSAAENEKLAAKQLVNGSAQSIANSIIILKAELADVDKRISSAVNELNKITGGISGALNETEKNLQTLGVQLEKFPEITKSAEFHGAKSTRIVQKRKSLSEALLEKLNILLK